MKFHSHLGRLTLGLLVVCGVADQARPELVLQWVTVRDPGNQPDPLHLLVGDYVGAVSYQYRIAKYEVTNDQYAEFLNAIATTDAHGLYNTDMNSDPRGGITQSGASGSFVYAVKPNMGDKPVIYVSFLDAARFVNWLHNGQRSGAQDTTTTEAGVYAFGSGALGVRAVAARFFIPTRDEWYKAAFYQPHDLGGDSDDFWLYPTASNALPTVASATSTGDISNPGSNVANYSQGADWNGQDGNVTTVGSAGQSSESYYGTTNQAGNVSEWTESVFDRPSLRYLAGGNWKGGSDNASSVPRYVESVEFEYHWLGFRVASSIDAGIPVPAVSSRGLGLMVVLLLGAGGMVLRRRVAV